jgi:hypothetical protein
METRERALGAKRAWKRWAPTLTIGLLCGSPTVVRIEGPHGSAFERVIREAFAEAAQRLARDPCVRILAEFHDRGGRSLAGNLEAQGLTAAEYLRTLVVFDGDSLAFCRSSRVLAGTRPGSHRVVFCGRRFSREQVLDPGFGAVIVIHEALHTLGLPEDPPSSETITVRVRERCGNE